MRYECSRLENLIRASKIKIEKLERLANTQYTALNQIDKGIKRQKKGFHEEADLQDKIKEFYGLKNKADELRDVYVDRTDYNNQLDEIIAFKLQNNPIKLPHIQKRLLKLNERQIRASTASVQRTIQVNSNFRKELNTIFNISQENKQVSAMKKFGEKNNRINLVKFDGVKKNSLMSKISKNRPFSNKSMNIIQKSETTIETNQSHQQSRENC